jgi:hypothetical protein
MRATEIEQHAIVTRDGNHAHRNHVGQISIERSMHKKKEVLN